MSNINENNHNNNENKKNQTLSRMKTLLIKNKKIFKEVLTTYEVAKCCHVSLTTIVNWIDEGSIKAYKTKGGHRRVRVDDLDNFLKKYNMPIFCDEKTYKRKFKEENAWSKDEKNEN